MELKEYQDRCMITANRFPSAKGKVNKEEIINAALGLGECGEVQNIIKKYIYHGHDLPVDDIISEMGDILYYLAWMSDILGISINDVATENLEKLSKRYPNGFSQEASLNRK